MIVSVALEYRFARLPDGTVWTRNQYALSFWQRYLGVFDGVRCIARVRDEERLEGEWLRADGHAVSFVALPHYVGPAQFLRRARSVRAAVRGAIAPGDAVILRVPGNIGQVAWRKLVTTGYPFGVEVLGDPYDVFSRGAVQHPLRTFFRWYTTRQLRRQCAGACAASYVTAHALQRRYPSPGPAIGASSIELPDRLLRPQPRVYSAAAGPIHLLFVGSLEQYYKGPDVLIRAVADTIRRGLDVRLTIIGEGRLRPDLETLSARLGCAGRVTFLGQLASAQVYPALDRADLFVLPSRTEGLPRAMVEAMARALPCIGAAAGGIPELLPSADIVAPGNVQQLADRICEVAGDPVRMNRMSAANLGKAREYRSDVLQERRTGFYREVRGATDRWLRSTQPHSGARDPLIQAREL